MTPYSQAEDCLCLSLHQRQAPLLAGYFAEEPHPANRLASGFPKTWVAQLSTFPECVDQAG
jgi:hypothetical protein